MADTFQSSQPIYLQLADRLNRQIVSGELKPGDKLPSVREMAVSSKVNPNTVQRTYRELEASGIVESRRGQGTFVTENEDILFSTREKLKNDQIENFIQVMHDMGYENEEIQAGLRLYLEGGGHND
ncbi:DNA-binding transcriptional regulator YhcF, GntR family [Terribacillus aidingensis]|uniref:DNA-binding transcriptional regulator YhcF, GntR family n=1 Tax=Terribacillus aidingensis TaxID=586416 RepID=A0A285P5K2_9BACI|nr:GntR family transcriptional regulator [Terribacillus aidingensis]SNZ16995.1 DNA-binding transcriptional regulator YhcF, GntR family [Terribacillus aidingensis]